MMEASFDYLNLISFNVHLLITHLLRSNNEGTIDYLINEMYTELLEDIDFYMPQISYMTLTEDHSNSLIKFILDMTPKYPNLGIKAMLYIISYSQDENSSLSEKASEVSNQIEACIVNNEVPPKYRTRAPEKESVVDPSFYLDKINRDKYKNEQLKFLEIMKNLSIKLKNEEIEDRNPKLQSKLKDLNRWIHKDLRGWEIGHDSIYEVKFHGIMIPLHEGDDRDPAIITNFHHTLARAFNTKARCPIMIVFETINLSEAKKRKEDLEEIAERSYDAFKKEYSNSKPSANEQTSFRVSQKKGDSFEHVSLEMEADSEDIVEEEKKSENDSSEIGAEEHLKSFEQFAKFVKIEEDIFSEKSDEQEYKEGDSVRSALYCYEYGNGITRRRKDVMEESKKLPRSRSEGDDLTRSKLFTVPRNVKKIKDSIHKKSEAGDASRKHADVSKAVLEMEQRRSVLMSEASGEENRKSDGIETFEKSSNVDVEEFPDLEGVKDPFGKDWAILEKEKKAQSFYRDFKTYKLRTWIFKSNDDLRQELLAVQLIKRLDRIFRNANLSLYLRPYEIHVTSHSSGYLEWIPNAISIDGIKKNMLAAGKDWNLSEFFKRRFYDTFEEWQKNFVESLAGYSFLWYVFNIKDRHNGNILLDNRGHLVHIDFGFLFSNSPGSLNFESAPFKFTQEYYEIMDDGDGTMFEYFKSLLNKAFYEFRKHLDDIISMIEIMFKETQFPCFKGGDSIFDEIRNRWSPRFNTGDNMHNEYQELVDRIIDSSLDNWRTKQYDAFQKWTNNIEK